jgi:uncharacterized protein YecE (DUF72 family)
VLQVAGKTRQTYVVANNHNLGKAAVNALELISMIENRKVDAPTQLVSKYPELEAVTID